MTGMVFERYPGGGGEFALALALADNAHDDGTSIYPSVQTLAKKSRQSERSVQYQLRKMEKMGWLILVSEGGGRLPGFNSGGKARQYRINPAWIKGADIAPLESDASEAESAKGAKIAPFQKGAETGNQGCKTASSTVQNDAVNGATAVAPEPRATKSNQEQPSHRECEREADPGALTAEQVDRELAGFGVVPTGIDRQTLARFVRHRAAIRRVLSVQGWLQVRQQLADLMANGHDPNESLKQTMAAGLALPVIPVAQQSAGATHANPQHSSADRIEQLQQQFEAERLSGGHGGGPGFGTAEFVEAEFVVVG